MRIRQRRMRILFVAARLPLPADTGGKIRSFNILKQLAKRIETRLVCFSFEKEDELLARDLESSIGVLTTLVPVRRWNLREQLETALFSAQPFSIAKYYSPEMVEALRSCHATEQFSVAHIAHLHMAHYITYLNDLPCIIDEQNVEYKVLERCASIERSFLKRIFFTNQARKMKTFEAQMIGQCSQFLAVSEDDRRVLSEVTNGTAQGHVITNGVDTGYFSPAAFPESYPKEVSLVFTGSMDWLPNEDAVLYFCRDILPLLWKEKPQLRFYVVGKSPGPSIKKLAGRDERIIVTGRVDDVRPIVAKARVFVVPIRIGGGTRIKILEGMAMQKAIVSTTVGAEGIEYTVGENIVLSDRPEDFAGNIIDLLNNPIKSKELGRRARDLVCGQYDWTIIGERLRSIYEVIGPEQ